MIERLFHCNVNCTDLDRSLEFYHMLGFKIDFDFREGMNSEEMAKAFGMAEAKLRGVHLVLEEHENAFRIDLVEFQSPKTEGKPYPHLYHVGIPRIGLYTKNLQQVYEELKAKNVDFFSPPQTFPGTDITIACFTDPDGTVLELIEGEF